ncbi:MAG: NADH-quinone oxidoreductase subunit NuoF [Tannerellaceae bacterium]|nr:NADH-quinone oxidoreductase subunit NuoF [Tannerellaceae bacterium]
MATCSLAAGAQGIWDIFQEAIDKGEIPACLVQTGCMGYCYAEPTVEITLPGCTPVIFGHLTKKKAGDILYGLLSAGQIPATVVSLNQTADACRGQIRIALRNCGVIDPENIEDYIAADGYRALAETISMNTPDKIIELLIRSGLRGRGGGGFPTGMKWKITRQSVAEQKYVVCNADEGDPGAFMDRSILEGDPHSVIEAMAINGFCTGASKGLIYIRAEYPLAVQRLHIAIQQARKRGLLGENILNSGFSFDIDIRYGAGAFVCGEETALIHSMEGLRGEATVKPPFPSVEGYKGYPTNVNNVETYANIPAILLKGDKWFASIGTDKSKGTKVFALAGKVKNVGLVEVPMGTTLREVIFEIGGGIKDGKKFKAVQTGGPSGGCLTEKHLDLPIDYDNLTAAGSMMGSGGMIVMDEDDCMVSVAQFYLDFTVEESCGKCAPCRIGNKRLHEMLQKITTGNGSMEDLHKLHNLARVIKETALCGLGQTSPNPVLSTLDNFYDEYLAHVQDRSCPAHQCPALTQYFINPDTCTGCMLCSRACPANAIRGERKSPHVIDPTTCIRCGACLDKCKFGAVSPLNLPKGNLKEGRF